MPTRVDINHLKLHIRAVKGDYPGDLDIQRRGQIILDALDVAPVSGQSILGYLNAAMASIGSSDSSQIRAWIVVAEGRSAPHITDISELLAGTLDG